MRIKCEYCGNNDASLQPNGSWMCARCGMSGYNKYRAYEDNDNSMFGYNARKRHMERNCYSASEKQRYGWVCPKCEAVISPNQTECSKCNSK